MLLSSICLTNVYKYFNETHLSSLVKLFHVEQLLRNCGNRRSVPSFQRESWEISREFSDCRKPIPGRCDSIVPRGTILRPGLSKTIPSSPYVAF